MKNKSFTLIELLVVISIIGLLATVVMVSVGSVRDKARIAAGLQFASDLDHSLMPVGKWSFEDDISDGFTDDTSGNNNHGTCTNCPSNTPNDITELGQALDFNGSGDYVKVADSTSLDLTDSITMQAWVKANELVP